MFVLLFLYFVKKFVIVFVVWLVLIIKRLFFFLIVYCIIICVCVLIFFLWKLDRVIFVVFVNEFLNVFIVFLILNVYVLLGLINFSEVFVFVLLCCVLWGKWMVINFVLYFFFCNLFIVICVNCLVKLEFCFLFIFNIKFFVFVDFR